MIRFYLTPMNLSFITSFFKKSQKPLTIPDTILIKKLKNLSTQSNLLVFKDVNIYHHTDKYTIPIMVLDDTRGLYLFETKEWTFDELKNAEIQKAQKQESSADTLAFENTHNIIRKKFNELTHNDGIPIFNFLLMENLNSDEYEHLNDSFKALLPRDKIIFSDSLQSDIFKKLQDVSPATTNLTTADLVMGTLLIQYAILDDENVHFANREQIAFIDKPLEQLNILNAPYKSGKSSLILLKSIVELFNNPDDKIIILKPTTLACDIFKKRLLEIVEHAIIEIDLSAIEIITPLDLVNRHNTKLGREHTQLLDIDDKLMKKSFDSSPLLICDDANIYNSKFIDYLKHLQKKDKLLFVNTTFEAQEIQTLTLSYQNEKREISFQNTNPYAKALNIIFNLVNDNEDGIVLAASEESCENLFDDLDKFITTQAQILESNLPLVKQKLGKVLLCKYSDINTLRVKHIIMIDLFSASENEIEYAFNLATESVNVLYEEDYHEIIHLRNKYEQSSQERIRVESTTNT